MADIVNRFLKILAFYIVFITLIRCQENNGVLGLDVLDDYDYGVDDSHGSSWLSRQQSETYGQTDGEHSGPSNPIQPQVDNRLSIWSLQHEKAGRMARSQQMSRNAKPDNSRQQIPQNLRPYNSRGQKSPQNMKPDKRQQIPQNYESRKINIPPELLSQQKHMRDDNRQQIPQNDQARRLNIPPELLATQKHMRPYNRQQIPQYDQAKKLISPTKLLAQLKNMRSDNRQQIPQNDQARRLNIPPELLAQQKNIRSDNRQQIPQNDQARRLNIPPELLAQQNNMRPDNTQQIPLAQQKEMIPPKTGDVRHSLKGDQENIRVLEEELKDMTGDPCIRNPCRHGGTCLRDVTNGVIGFQCACMFGYRGKTCSEEMVECDKSPCTSRGDCVATLSGYICVCEGGFAGQMCEVKISNGIKWDQLQTVLTEETMMTVELVLAILLLLLLILAIASGIHCCRVNAKRKKAREEYRRAVKDGRAPTDFPPDWCDISNDLCCCCRCNTSNEDKFSKRNSNNSKNALIQTSEDSLTKLIESRSNHFSTMSIKCPTTSQHSIHNPKSSKNDLEYYDELPMDEVKEANVSFNASRGLRKKLSSRNKQDSQSRHSLSGSNKTKKPVNPKHVDHKSDNVRGDRTRSRSPLLRQAQRNVSPAKRPIPQNTGHFIARSNTSATANTRQHFQQIRPANDNNYSSVYRIKNFTERQHSQPRHPDHSSTRRRGYPSISRYHAMKNRDNDFDYYSRRECCFHNAGDSETEAGNVNWNRNPDTVCDAAETHADYQCGHSESNVPAYHDQMFFENVHSHVVAPIIRDTTNSSSEHGEHGVYTYEYDVDECLTFPDDNTCNSRFSEYMYNNYMHIHVPSVIQSPHPVLSSPGGISKSLHCSDDEMYQLQDELTDTDGSGDLVDNNRLNTIEHNQQAQDSLSIDDEFNEANGGIAWIESRTGSPSTTESITYGILATTVTLPETFVDSNNHEMTVEHEFPHEGGNTYNHESHINNEADMYEAGVKLMDDQSMLQNDIIIYQPHDLSDIAGYNESEGHELLSTTDNDDRKYIRSFESDGVTLYYVSSDEETDIDYDIEVYPDGKGSVKVVSMSDIHGKVNEDGDVGQHAEYNYELNSSATLIDTSASSGNTTVVMNSTLVPKTS